MKATGLTVLALLVALGGCAQKKGNAPKEASKLESLEARFNSFQEQQRARDADIDFKLREIASRLDQFSAGKPPAQARPAREQSPRAASQAPARGPVRAGQVIPYSQIAGGAAQAPQAAAPAPLPQATPGSRAPSPLQAPAQAAAQPTAPAAPRPLDAAISPPVVTLSESMRNVPPAAQTRQPVTVDSRRARPAKAEAPAPRPVAAPRQPEPLSAPQAAAPAAAPAPVAQAPEVPNLEPALPTAPVPASPQPKPLAPQAQAPASPASPPASSQVGMDEQMLYTEALRAVSANKNDDGRKKFNEFMAKYPGSAKTPEALYWIGESYMGDKSYNQAILSFKDVSSRFPKDPKAEAALYRAAEAYEFLGDKANAAFHLKVLVEEHPNSEFAGKARQKLKQLGQ